MCIGFGAGVDDNDDDDDDDEVAVLLTFFPSASLCGELVLERFPSVDVVRCSGFAVVGPAVTSFLSR